MRWYQRYTGVAEANPLKQGLKHFDKFHDRCLPAVAEANPLKQGLKQDDVDIAIEMLKSLQRLIH